MRLSRALPPGNLRHILLLHKYLYHSVNMHTRVRGYGKCTKPFTCVCAALLLCLRIWHNMRTSARVWSPGPRPSLSRWWRSFSHQVITTRMLGTQPLHGLAQYFCRSCNIHCEPRCIYGGWRELASFSPRSAYKSAKCNLILLCRIHVRVSHTDGISY